MSDSNPVLLIVEDNPEDLELIRRGLAGAGVVADLHFCADGDQALDFLLREGMHQSAPVPALILLDLNLPGTDGLQVLKEKQKLPDIASIPVVIFSNSSNINDVNACYAAGANSFIEKPLGPAAFAAVMTQLKDYWFQLVRLPDASL